MFVARYSIDRNTDLERFFNVDALSGVISTAKPLDREANSIHNLTIFAIESRKSKLRKLKQTLSSMLYHWESTICLIPPSSSVWAQ